MKFTNTLQRSVHDADERQRVYRLAASKSRAFVWKLMRMMLVIGISFIIIYPLIVKLSVSIMSRSDMNDVAVRWIAKNPTLDNFAFSFNAMRYPTAFVNTLFTCVVCTLLQMFSCCLAAYAFVKLKFPGSKLLFVLAVFTLVVPPQTYMMGMYAQTRFFNPFGLVELLTGRVGLINTYWPIFIRSLCGVGVRNGLYIYLMTQFFRNMPTELEEAAHVDGASPFKTFYRIMLPNAVPILVTIAVFSFVWQWNDEFYAAILTPDFDFISRNLYRIDNMITIITGAYVDDPAYTSILKNAASLLAVAPLMLVFVAAQKFFVENFERSGIVG